MYDKYFNVNPIKVDGSAIPKNKGILINNGGVAGQVNFYFVNASGNTFLVGLTFPAANHEILPIQPYGISSLGAGITAFYLN